MATTIAAEVCVVGGGPAGSTFARQLALLGHEVCLLEQSAFPRQHVGESLVPSILPLLELLGLRERIEGASFLRPTCSLVRWASDEVRAVPSGADPGFQVDRGRFDLLLLDSARRAGVGVLQPARALRPLRCRSGWRVPFEAPGGAGSVACAFVADATGRCRLTGVRMRRLGAQTLALYGYWRGVPASGTETRVEARPDGWFWGAPLPDGLFNATVFVDPGRCKGSGGGGLTSLYRSLLGESALLGGCLEGELVGDARACDATSATNEPALEDGLIRVGEASYSVDPLSSQGVQAAMNSAVQAALAVHTQRMSPENANAAGEFYRDRQQEGARWHARTVAAFYSEQEAVCATPFWRRRAVKGEASRPVPTGTAAWVRGSERLRLSDEARVRRTPILEGDLIRYSEALGHPSLDRPVAFLGGVEVVALLRRSPIDGLTFEQQVSAWAAHVPREAAQAVLRWLCDRGVAVPSVTSSDGSPPPADT